MSRSDAGPDGLESFRLTDLGEGGNASAAKLWSADVGASRSGDPRMSTQPPVLKEFHCRPLRQNLDNVSRCLAPLVLPPLLAIAPIGSLLPGEAEWALTGVLGSWIVYACVVCPFLVRFDIWTDGRIRVINPFQTHRFSVSDIEALDLQATWSTSEPVLGIRLRDDGQARVIKVFAVSADKVIELQRVIPHLFEDM